MCFSILRERPREICVSVCKVGVAVLFAAVLILQTAACNRGNAAAPAGPPSMPVKVETVQDQPIGDTSEYVATIKSRNSATIMSYV
jgi:hypothetical protein